MRRHQAITNSRLDRAITAVAPQWAANRLRARYQVAAMGGGYGGARTNKRGMQTWSTKSYTANQALAPDLAYLRDRSRDLVRNSPLAVGAVNTVATNVVGTGLRPLPRIDREVLGLDDAPADAIERQIERAWSAWADTTA